MDHSLCGLAVMSRYRPNNPLISSSKVRLLTTLRLAKQTRSEALLATWKASLSATITRRIRTLISTRRTGTISRLLPVLTLIRDMITVTPVMTTQDTITRDTSTKISVANTAFSAILSV